MRSPSEQREVSPATAATSSVPPSPSLRPVDAAHPSCAPPSTPQRSTAAYSTTRMSPGSSQHTVSPSLRHSVPTMDYSKSAAAARQAASAASAVVGTSPSVVCLTVPPVMWYDTGDTDDAVDRGGTTGSSVVGGGGGTSSSRGSVSPRRLHDVYVRRGSLVTDFVTLAPVSTLTQSLRQLDDDSTVAAGGADLQAILYDIAAHGEASSENRKKLGTARIRDRLAYVAQYISSAECLVWFAKALVVLIGETEVKRSFGTESLRDAFLAAAELHCTSLPAALAVASFLNLITSGMDSNKRLYGCVQCRDVWCKAARFAQADSVELFARALCGVTTIEENKLLFGNAEVRDAIVSLANLAECSNAVEWLAGAVNNIVFIDTNRRTFGTPAVRDAVCGMATFATSADSAEWLCRAYTKLTADSDNRRHVFGTEGYRDVLVSLAFRANTVESAYWVATAFNSITSEPDNKPLYGTPPVRDALMALSLQTTSPEAVEKLARALCGVTSLHEHKKLFGTLEVRERLTALAHRAASSTSVEWLAGALNNITINEDNRKLFSTDDVRDAIVCMCYSAKSCDSVEWLCRLTNKLTTDALQKKRFGTAAVRQGFIALATYVDSEDSVEWWSRAMNQVNCDGESRKVFTTPAMRDAICNHVCPKCRSAVAVEHVSRLLCSLTNTEEQKRVFGTAAVAATIVALAPVATSAASVEWLSGVVSNITCNPENKKWFCTSEFRDAMVILCRSATAPDAVEWISRVFCKLSVEPEHKTLLGVPAVRDALVTLAASATTTDSTYWFVSAVNNITIDKRNKDLFAVPSVHDALVALSEHISNAEGVEWFARAVSNLTTDATHRQVFHSEPFRDALVALSKGAVSACAVEWLARDFCLLSCSGADHKSQLITVPVRDALVAMAPHARSSNAVEWLCGVMYNLCIQPAGAELYCTPVVRDALVCLATHATTNGSAEWISRVVGRITLTRNGKDVFATDALCTALIGVASHAVQQDAILWWCTALGNIGRCEPCRGVLTSQATAVKQQLVRMCPLCTSGDSARWWCAVVEAFAHALHPAAASCTHTSTTQGSSAASAAAATSLCTTVDDDLLAVACRMTSVASLPKSATLVSQWAKSVGALVAGFPRDEPPAMSFRARLVVEGVKAAMHAAPIVCDPEAAQAIARLLLSISRSLTVGVLSTHLLAGMLHALAQSVRDPESAEAIASVLSTRLDALSPNERVELVLDSFEDGSSSGGPGATSVSRMDVTIRQLLSLANTEASSGAVMHLLRIVLQSLDADGRTTGKSCRSRSPFLTTQFLASVSSACRASLRTQQAVHDLSACLPLLVVPVNDDTVPSSDSAALLDGWVQLLLAVLWRCQATASATGEIGITEVWEQLAVAAGRSAPLRQQILRSKDVCDACVQCLVCSAGIPGLIPSVAAALATLLQELVESPTSTAASGSAWDFGRIWRTLTDLAPSSTEGRAAAVLEALELLRIAAVPTRCDARRAASPSSSISSAEQCTRLGNAPSTPSSLVDRHVEMSTQELHKRVSEVDELRHE